MAYNSEAVAMEMNEAADTLDSEVFKHIRRVARRNNKLFAIWVCRATLGIESAVPNPLLQAEAIKQQEWHEEMAWTILEKLDDVVRPGRRRFEGYQTTLDWFGSDIGRPNSMQWRRVGKVTGDQRVRTIIDEFFWAQLVDFELCAQGALTYVYQGVPLYRLNADGRELECMPYSDDDYIYLSKKGQYADSMLLQDVPRWATTYYFRTDHVDAAEMFFGSELWELPMQEMRKRRAAFRRHIGIEAEDAGGTITLRNRSQSSLLPLLPEIENRYYGPRFEPGNPETWTRQEVITSWLRSTFNISAREAECLDVIIRSNLARRKGW